MPLTNYPAALDDFPVRIDGIDQTFFAEHMNFVQEAIEALEATLGINPQGLEVDVVTRLNAIDAAVTIALNAASAAADLASNALDAANNKVDKSGDTMIGELVVPTIDTNGININQGAGQPEYTFAQSSVDTTNATQTVLQTIPIAIDSTMVIECRIIARRTGGLAGASGDSLAQSRPARIKNVGGIVTIQAFGLLWDGSDQGWSSTLVVSGSNVQLRVTGAANNNITWHVTTILQRLS